MLNTKMMREQWCSFLWIEDLLSMSRLGPDVYFTLSIMVKGLINYTFPQYLFLL